MVWRQWAGFFDSASSTKAAVSSSGAAYDESDEPT